MSAVELTWLIHRRNVSEFAEHRPKRMRAYLQAVSDLDTLRAWDASRFKEGDE